MLKKLLLLLCLCFNAFSQDCSTAGELTDTTGGSAIDNNARGCIAWRLTYSSSGFSAFDLQIEYAPDGNGAPGAFTAISNSYSEVGTNPISTVPAGTLVMRDYYGPWIRVRANAVTGTGKIKYTLLGYKGTQSRATGVGAVTSVFTRTGPVVKAEGDYNLADLGDVASKQGNGTAVQMYAGAAPTLNNYPKFDANGNLGPGDAGGSGITVMTTGAGPPSANCVAPSGSNLALYTDTTNLDLWGCVATNTWKKLLSTVDSGAWQETVYTGTVGSTPAADYLVIGADSATNKFYSKDEAGLVSYTVPGNPTINRTRQFGFMLGGDTGTALTASEDQLSIFYNGLGGGITITSVWCETDVGTATINLQKDDGSPANILTSDLVCDTTGEATTAFVSTQNLVASTDKIDWATVSVASAPKRVTLNVTYTID